MDKADFVESSTSFLHPYLELVKEDEDLTPYFDLPSVLVPPEVIELENLADGAVDNAPVQKNEEWPEYRVKIFDNDVGDLLCPALASTLQLFTRLQPARQLCLAMPCRLCCQMLLTYLR